MDIKSTSLSVKKALDNKMISSNSSRLIEVHEIKPEDFNARVEVAAVYVEVHDKVLFLQISKQKKEGGLWGVPAGKQESNETPQQASIRELYEETGIKLENHLHPKFVGTLYIRKPDLDYNYHVFHAKFTTTPTVIISNEHQSYKWVSMNEINTISLMAGAKEALDYCVKLTSSKVRTDASVNVYLVLRKDDKILLHLRKNTGYCDGLYGLVSGHVENGESAVSSIIREAAEEAGILIKSSDLNVVHMMHRQTNRSNVDIFFECCVWDKLITNKEPEKCEELKFYPLNKLPNNMVNYINDALRCILKSKIYSEEGWK
ncbi:MAG: NUDIX hydrolase [Parachlamydiaceae bacterium]|nr:NUDIX hydrolase [Parachlamydiaceae bacterium]